MIYCDTKWFENSFNFRYASSGARSVRRIDKKMTNSLQAIRGLKLSCTIFLSFKLNQSVLAVSIHAEALKFMVIARIYITPELPNEAQKLIYEIDCSITI